LRGPIHIKGKDEMITYFLNPKENKQFMPWTFESDNIKVCHSTTYINWTEYIHFFNQIYSFFATNLIKHVNHLYKRFNQKEFFFFNQKEWFFN
jgi:hypothetical protein